MNRDAKLAFIEKLKYEFDLVLNKINEEGYHE